VGEASRWELEPGDRARLGAKPAVVSALTGRVYKAANLVSEPEEPLASKPELLRRGKKRKRIDKKYRDKLARLLGELEQTTERRKAAGHEVLKLSAKPLGQSSQGS